MSHSLYSPVPLCALLCLLKQIIITSSVTTAHVTVNEYQPQG